MKIRTRLTLQYSFLTVVILVIFSLLVVFVQEKNREKTFYHALRKEAIIKANLLLQNKVDASTMQLIYLNNREFLDEVEVAIYDTGFNLLYHDAMEIDIVKENPAMIDDIVRNQTIEFYVDRYQATGLVYHYGDKDYVVTAAGFDGKGHAQLVSIIWVLLSVSLVGIGLSLIVGNVMARKALRPIADIIGEMKRLTAKNLNKRLDVDNPKDEIGELAITFNHLLNRLEESFNAQKTFAGNVAHELRTALTVLVAELDIALKKDLMPDEYRVILQHVRSSALSLASLSSDLLDFAKAHYDVTQIARHDVRLDELLLDAHDMVKKNEPDYTINILYEQEIEDDRAITVSGNEYLLKIAFANLIENNCKYSPNSTSTVQISSFAENAVISFSDTGIGIADEELPHIFKPFYRGKNSRYASGNGIGMALVDRIVALHDGSVEIRSHVGSGTTFIVKLPHI